MIDGIQNSLNEEEINKIKEVLKLKKDIMSYLNMGEFINKTRNIIDDSEIFEFRSKVARNYIDKKNPSFTLRIKDENIHQEMLTYKDPRNEVNKLLQKDIIGKISKLLTDSINNSNNKLFDAVPKDVTEFILSNIYVIRSNIKENNIQIYFFV